MYMFFRAPGKEVGEALTLVGHEFLGNLLES